MKMTSIKVRNMTSPNGNIVANQFIITTEKGIYFQSYKSVIVFRGYDMTTILDEHYWDYSVTTGKYRNQFLNENIAETRKKIKSGEYKLADLNG